VDDLEPDLAEVAARWDEDSIEELAESYGHTYYHRSWDKLTAVERIGLRARARRYLGL